MNNERIAQIAAHKREVINKLQGLKSESYNRAHDLYNAKNNQAQVNKLSTEEREITDNHPLDLFVTPTELADRMVKLADIKNGQAVLEPSAGTGKIAEAIRETGFDPVCVELNYRAYRLLQERGFNVLCEDFLEHYGNYDRIIMNPPFKDDIEHVKYAYNLLNEGGRIIAIMSEGPFFRQDRKSREFRDWLDNIGTSEKLPPGTFKTSGTLVTTRLVIINREEL